ncbi:nicotinate-nucleotide--dimethylbenzimidazole phosphoribosyltransferase [Vibrio sp. ZSDZ65]|uniref:Nicotinate-nucleotide--dimethylbenzimidazole phosphoribosyltransferase n=1 Tax=Vibrio qingdaonensis TaxID=2829491 RepID=A0A9X3CKW8_9VIBR|nr:nicotinate-nucleotide--dimethylbenzimidazole phosphoribosyltransferase [Vibrio qingdaonensis]MCW8345115.1 nicotinate-nucleotide--dimethylbenzimidazole phosphoribosyltransferase [Vibrio qingdaonensis]
MLDKQFDAQIQHRIDQKTKPLGALGALENVAFQLAQIQSNRTGKLAPSISIDAPSVIVFAGDHGIANQGVSIAPSSVTQQMVLNFLAGGAAINCFCRTNHLAFSVVDCGMEAAVESDSQDLIVSRVAASTHDFSVQAAMSMEHVAQGLSSGSEIVTRKVEAGCELLIFGEMGIGNTSSASALLSSIAHVPVEQSVGFGTGITLQQLSRKRDLVQLGIERCADKSVMEVLSEVGGHEIVHMVGAFISAAEHKIPVLVDGFIVSVAALVATKMVPETRDYMIFSHRSDEGAHKLVLERMQARPLLDLSLRLGEGTGAALAYPLLACAVEFYNHMASFESAGVTV